MVEDIGKLFYVFILGIVVIVIGIPFSSLEVVLLGGLLAGISGMIMVVSIAAKWK